MLSRVNVSNVATRGATRGTARPAVAMRAVQGQGGFLCLRA